MDHLYFFPVGDRQYMMFLILISHDNGIGGYLTFPCLGENLLSLRVLHKYYIRKYSLKIREHTFFQIFQWLLKQKEMCNKFHDKNVPMELFHPQMGQFT